MDVEADRYEARLIPRGTVDHHVALHRVLDVKPTPVGFPPARKVADLLASERHGTVSIDLLVGAYRGSELVSACLGVVSPGAAALVLTSPDVAPRRQYRATVAALWALQQFAWQRSIVVLEALVAPRAGSLGQVMQEAGFRRLTRLDYFRLDVTSTHAPSGSTPPRGASDLEWVEFTPDSQPLFEEAVERTYAQSMDCPELTGLRKSADVLAGHRASGIFDPASWWVVLRDNEPAGVLLLNRTPSEPAMEVVYMGVTQASRGTGVGDALLRKAVERSRQRDAKTLALAMDHRNAPARRLYSRWGFVEAGSRDAWIASSHGA